MNNDQNGCINCGKDISFKRNDAKYCNSRCRMQFQRKMKKIELIEELFNTCSQIPHHTSKNNDGEFLLKTHKAIKNNSEMITISELMDLSVGKIERLIAKKREEVNAHIVVKGLSKLFNK